MSQTIYRLRKAMKGPLNPDLGNEPLVNPKLAQFTLAELLDEIVERSTGWNHCAVGERFEISENDEHVAAQQIMAEGLTQHQANVILNQGRQFEDFCIKARTAYHEIQKVQK